jgi:hypothetical protein
MRHIWVAAVRLLALGAGLFSAVITMGAGTAAAQDYKNEIAVTIGRTFISDQGVPNTSFFDNVVHSGKGLSLNFNYARRLLDFHKAALSVELPVVYNPDEDLNFGENTIPKQYSSLFITPGARLTFFPHFVVQPWLSFGGGIGHFVASTDLVFSGTNPGPRVKTTSAIDGGVGFDVPLYSRLKFRFEARDNWSGVPPINVDTGKTRQHNYYVGGGGVVRF